ncbi:MAG: efflux RND transporter periplasmic adaptor subunit [Patescibacteria group bacterium]|nr:efflux RND transporter periplasmic adaptor subunit [Patescibacteria group bacterium]MDE1945588.1 efflux RND transporter periplasmic adaptor subunit [Patescibacteria group bacterium]
MEEKQKTGKNHLKTPWVQSVIIIALVIALLFIFLYWLATRDTIFIENSYLDAPIATIAPTSPGILSALYAKEGDTVGVNTPVALVGTETLYAKDPGIVASAPRVLGSYYAPGETVMSIVDDDRMRAVGEIEETKGLKDVAVGDRATFTVDAFPGKTYQGVVDEIGAVSEDTGVAFSISDERPVKKFDIYVRFDHARYPELASGMSAKITVFTAGN